MDRCLASSINILLLLLLSSLSLLGERIVYPQTAVGPLAEGAFEIELRLGNRSDAEWRGEARLLRQQTLASMQGLLVEDGEGLLVNVQDGTFPIVLDDNGSVIYRISSDLLQEGVLVLEGEATDGQQALISSFYYRLMDPQGTAVDLIAIEGVRKAHTGFRLMLSDLPSFKVGIAAVAEKNLFSAALGSSSTGLELTVILPDGSEHSAQVELDEQSGLQQAFFPDELIPDLGDDIATSQLKIRATDAIYLTTLAVGSPPEFEDVQIGAAPAEPDVDVPFTGLIVDRENREDVVDFFNRAYRASDGVAVGWTGDEDGCVPGVTSRLFKEALLRRINFFRAMAGVPADIVFDPELNAKAQAMALMMIAENRASHNPDPSWECFSQGGLEAAARSNLLYLPSGTPTARSIIDTYMRDSGPGNFAVGHRRLILLPSQRVMGSGTAETLEDSANALWVQAQRGAGPQVRSAWPAEGFIPFPVLFSRWSFSFPAADFSGAVVTMTRDGEPVTLSQEPVVSGFGDPTLVWIPDIPLETPASDVTFQVTIDNVTVENSQRSFSYQVTVIDPGRE